MTSSRGYLRCQRSSPKHLYYVSFMEVLYWCRWDIFIVFWVSWRHHTRFLASHQPRNSCACVRACVWLCVVVCALGKPRSWATTTGSVRQEGLGGGMMSATSGSSFHHTRGEIRTASRFASKGQRKRLTRKKKDVARGSVLSQLYLQAGRVGKYNDVTIRK